MGSSFLTKHRHGKGRNEKGSCQDHEQTSNKSFKKDDVRPRSGGESKACQDCRQGIRSSCTQEDDLNMAQQVSRVFVWETPQRFAFSGMLVWWGCGNNCHCI